MTSEEPQVCQVCGVKIVKAIGGDQVIFSAGPPGTRAKLAARVCQFTSDNRCLNKDPGLIGQMTADDYYKPDA
ncbi:MAG: hypothetical protein ACFBSC_14730 [Microcoleaceae cyanobacterium]